MRRSNLDPKSAEAIALVLVACAIAALLALRGALRVDADGDGPSRSRIDINAADSRKLRLLAGVGERTAAAIVDTRDARAGFETPFEILSVPGIGSVTFGRMRRHVLVNGKERGSVPE